MVKGGGGSSPPLPKVDEPKVQNSTACPQRQGADREPENATPGTSAPPSQSKIQNPKSAIAQTSALPHLTAEQLAFLHVVTPPALDSERAHGIPACITLAQAILESATSKGWGTSSLFTKANNPFGIKYSHRQGVERYGFFDALTWEIENGHKVEIMAHFQRFPDLWEAFDAHALLLLRMGCGGVPWLRVAAQLGPKNSKTDLEHCGYSTNPGYAAELIRLVDLYRLNEPRAQQWFATGKDPGPQMTQIAQMEKSA